MTITLADIQRFEDKVAVAGADECWLWTAGCDPDGYGHFKLNGKTVRAHRLAYELAVGPIPDGLQIDHVKKRGCRHKNCVNPRHLEPVTCRENLARGDTLNAANVAKTHCPEGHKYTLENTYINPRGARVCRICHYGDPEEKRTYNQAYYAANADRIARVNKAWYDRNAERARAVARARYYRNRDKILAQKKQKYAEAQRAH